MTRDEREHMNWLCRRIQEERDPKKFTELLTELNHLLEKVELSSRLRTAGADD
jgi:hypothetical protein